jgi:hypothetical protein
MKAAQFILIFLTVIPCVVDADDFSSRNRLAQEYFEAGDDLWEAENYRGALEKYSLALSKDPTFVEAYIARKKGSIFLLL